MPRRFIFFIALSVFTSLFAACGSGDTPEEQVRLFLKAGEEAAEARDPGALKKLISADYGDDRGRTRRDIVAIAARYFLANKNIHILARVGELSFPEGDRADLVLYAAITGQNVSDLDALLNMRADLYRFDMQLLRKEGNWQLVRADWRSAGAEDFF